jgi:hypothetical protein
MLKGVGRVGWTRSRKGYVITIPKDVALDSAFPFRRGDLVVIEIDTNNRRLIISKVEGV